jgi:predicted PurR-regulated permease PerM
MPAPLATVGDRVRVMSAASSAALSRHQIVSWVLTGLALLAVLQLHLLPALLAGLLSFQLVHGLSGALRIPYLTSRNAKILLVTLLAIIVIALLVLAGVGIAIFLRRGPDNLALLLTQLAAIVDDLRRLLPAGLVEHLPSENRDVRAMIAGWFREHATELRTFGTDTLRAFVHILIGLILGGLIALYEVTPHVRQSPFLSALQARAELLAGAFRRILLAQLPISAINTALTALYLVVVLPAFGVHLPFTKTLIVVTFIAGLLPVVGNLISNTAIFLVSLSLSFGVALAALGYLVVIHKLEYFLNARIVGVRIDAHAWELLLAMLVLESAYGIAGLIAAPVFYAYLKSELATQGLLGKPVSTPG